MTKSVRTHLLFALLTVLVLALACTAAGAETREDVWIDASLGRLYGELSLPDAQGPVPLVIMCHGIGSSHYFNRNYAGYFVSRGMATFNFDFCGGGLISLSDGEMTQMSVLTEARDLNAVMDHFAGDPRFSEVFLWGSSQGGFVSAYVAAQRPADVAAMVLEFPGFVIPDAARSYALPDGSYPETIRLLGMPIGRVYAEDATSFDIYAEIGAYTGDVLILHGDEDVIVPIEYSYRALDAYEHEELVVMEGQNHGFRGAALTEAMERESAFFLAHTQE